jgi:hypothetical protein
MDFKYIYNLLNMENHNFFHNFKINIVVKAIFGTLKLNASQFTEAHGT